MRHKAVLIWESVHGVDNVLVSLRTCVLQYKDVFPSAFCVCSSGMRDYFVDMFADRK